MLALAIAILAVAQNADYMTDDDSFSSFFSSFAFAFNYCEKGRDLLEPACSSAYSITDSRYCVRFDGVCTSIYKMHRLSCFLLNRPFRSYTDFRDWNATFSKTFNNEGQFYMDQFSMCPVAIAGGIEDDHGYTPDELGQMTATCNQMCVASDDSEDDNQIGLIWVSLGLSLGLGLPAIGVLMYFLVIRPNQKKNGTRNTVDTEPLM